MTSKLFYCKKCGSFLQLRVEIKIFVNYALQRKEKTFACFTDKYVSPGNLRGISLRFRVHTDQGNSCSQQR